MSEISQDLAVALNALKDLQDLRRQEHLQRVAEAGKCYSDDFIVTLAKDFHIRPDKAQTTREVLAFAAWLYRDLRDEDQQRPRAKQLRVEMLEIKDAAVALQNKLASLSPAGAELLWRPYEHMSSLMFHQPDGAGPFGLTIRRIRVDDTTEEVRYLNEYQLREALNVIANLADHAHRLILPERRGAHPNEALRMWVVNMQNLFVKVLGKRFTHTPAGGEGKSEAFRLCWRAINLLDPGVTRATLITEMRKAIELSGRVKGKGRGSRQRVRKITRPKS